MAVVKACSASTEIFGIGREPRVLASIRTATECAIAAHRPAWNSACVSVTEERPMRSMRVPTCTVPGQCSSLSVNRRGIFTPDRRALETPSH